VPPGVVPPVPPPPFALELDSGVDLVDDLTEARADLRAARRRMCGLAAEHARLSRAAATEGRLRREAEGRVTRAAAAEVAAAGDVRRLAVRAYMHGSPELVNAALGSFSSSDGVVAVTRNLRLLEQIGDDRTDDLVDARSAHREAEGAAARHARLASRYLSSRDSAAKKLEAEFVAASVAAKRIEANERAADQWHRLAVSSSSPILGPSRLNDKDLASFVRESGLTPKTTVTIEELARMFIEEGAAEGVRGDVAWAQSILETGFFTLPGGKVRPSDNNFAGIGACDSCERGHVFPDARTGVRAQMQLLRTYADGEVGIGGFAHAAVLPGSLRLGFRGFVRSWWDLGGRWASGPDYGSHVYDIYLRIVAAAVRSGGTTGGRVRTP